MKYIKNNIKQIFKKNAKKIKLNLEQYKTHINIKLLHKTYIIKTEKQTAKQTKKKNI